MADKVRSWELVEHLLDASVSPERLDELIVAWDAQAAQAGLNHPRLSDFAGSAFAHQVAGVLQVLEQMHAAELRRADDLLPSMLAAAMVLAQDGTVVAANDAAGRLFGLRPGGSIRQMPLDAADLATLAARLAEIAAGAEGGRERITYSSPLLSRKTRQRWVEPEGRPKISTSLALMKICPVMAIPRAWQVIHQRPAATDPFYQRSCGAGCRSGRLCPNDAELRKKLRSRL